MIPAEIENKSESKKHNVRVNEIRQALMNEPRIRFAEKGNVKGNDVYVVFGQTFGGRYLSMFFIYKPENYTSIIVSVCYMRKKRLSSISKANTSEEMGEFRDAHDFMEFKYENYSYIN